MLKWNNLLTEVDLNNGNIHVYMSGFMEYINHYGKFSFDNEGR